MIRNPKENEIEILKNIWQDVFKDTNEYINLFFTRKFDIKSTFVYELDGEIVSVIYGVLEEMNNYKGYYICGVATRKEYRKRGISSLLMEHMLDFVENEKSDFCFLIPASNELFDFYKKFGFEEFSYLNHRCIKPNASNISYEYKTEFDYEKLKKFYDRIYGNKITRNYNQFLDIYNCYKNLRIYNDGYLIYFIESKKLIILEYSLIKVENYATQILKEFNLEECEIISHYDEFKGYNKLFSMCKKFTDCKFKNIKNNYVNLMLN